MIEQGDNVAVDVKEDGKTKKKLGVFIKNYGRYIQIMNRYGLRESIMKQDIIRIKKCK